ncbi:hypothetical protein SO802_023887 [Lithocarpus litseifolius]|uniref:HMG box domain-containing protein n=1 Tax=Lithocarpus litseifolius TaxID=425828 RepID=A0AAW2CAL5_9ROSI
MPSKQAKAITAALTEVLTDSLENVAHSFLSKTEMQRIKKENPEAEFKDISNILGAKWKNVTAEEKKPYEEKYQSFKPMDVHASKSSRLAFTITVLTSME